MFSLRGTIGHIAMRVFGLFPIKKKIVFSSFDGKSFGDNPKAIYDEIIDRKIPCKLIWLMYDENIVIPGAEVVKAYSLKGLFHQATSKVWIFNSRQRNWIVKRKGQLYIQTWHAGITMKKVEKDAIEKLPQYYIDEAKHDSRMADYFISASKWNTDNYKNAFWYDGQILEIGIPRSDVFFKDSEGVKEKVYKKLSIDKESHTVLYAPTFRNNGSLEPYNIDYDEFIKCLENKWPGKWTVILRLHPNIQAMYKDITQNGKIINGSEYPDINEMILASDILITDYSSCMFDALECGKKVLLYAPDYKEYFSERGTYFDYSNVPFPVAVNNEELRNCVQVYDEDIYITKGKLFLKKCGVYNDGSASKKVADIVERALK